MNKDSWEILKLGEICEIISGSTPKTNINEYWNGKYNWVTPAELNDELDTIYDTQRKITAKAIKETNLKLLPKGAILLSSRAPIGKVAIAGNDMYSNQGFKNLICSKKIYNRYLFRFLKGKTEYLNSLGRGATFKEISKEIVSNIPIPIPPISLQEQIVKELDTLSDIITKKKEQLAELDKLAQATFYDMFGDPVENEKQWKTEKLDTLCTKITDGEHFRPETTSEGIPFLSAKDILQEGISFKNALFVTQETAKKALRRCNPEKNDILIVSRGATVGRMNIVKTDQVFCLLGSVILLKFKPNELSSYFLLQTLRNPDVLNKIRGLSSSSAQQALYLKDLKLLSIPVPPLFLQNQFAEKIEAIEKQKALINQSITDTQLLFDYTMDKYFN